MISRREPGLRALFVTHGGASVGGGHLSRSFALALALRDCGVDVNFALNAEGAASFAGAARGAFAGTFRAASFADPFSMASDERGSLAPFFDGVDFAVVDSYRASLPWLAWAAERLPLVVIDDFRDRPVERHATALLNYNLDAEVWPYAFASGTLRLLGPDYALLRPEVALWADRIADEVTSGKAVFFVAGASDMAGVTASVISWWKEEWPPLMAVVGPLVEEPYRQLCRAEAAERENVALLEAPPDFVERMARSGLVICTSSVTAYEALALRRPLAVFQVADNQRGIGEAIQAKGLGVDLGPWGSFGCPHLEALIRRFCGKDSPAGEDEKGRFVSARGGPGATPSAPARAVVNPRGAHRAAAALVGFFEAFLGRGGRP